MLICCFSLSYDNGDSVGTLRSTSRADVWKEAHAKAGYVLSNMGYKGMSHGGSDYEKDLAAIEAKIKC